MLDDPIINDVVRSALIKGMPLKSGTNIKELTIAMWEELAYLDRPIIGDFQLFGSVATMNVIAENDHKTLIKSQIGPDSVTFSLPLPVEKYEKQERKMIFIATMMMVSGFTKNQNQVFVDQEENHE